MVETDAPRDPASGQLSEPGWLGADRPGAGRLRATAHFWWLVGQSFIRNRCPIRASALAYTTLLALVPVLAIAMSVVTSLLKDKGDKPANELVEKLVSYLAPALDLQVKQNDFETTAHRQEVVEKINAFIANFHSGTLGVTSTIALVFVAISLLRTIEATFNDIWGVTRGRSLGASIVQYWAVITLGPAVIVAVVALTSGSRFEVMRLFLEELGPGAKFLFSLLPFVILSLAFGLFYQLMPNTQVQWRAALIGGVVGGCLWQLNNMFNTIYVSRVVTYSKIYGSLGVIPVFLIGLYFSWIILLFGAQVAYAYQNRAAYAQEKLAEGIHQRGREFIAFRLMVELARGYAATGGPRTVTELSATLGVPSRLSGKLLGTLAQAKLVTEAATGETAYIPARPLDQITMFDITHALRTAAGRDLDTADDGLRAAVREEFERVQMAEQQAGQRVTLAELAKAG